ncbi:sensor histidine kinase [Pedobacter alpinus]|uniref:Oxygen sensor histidine kinase NreB n=1 Tax=Pedobacter alpinus TaxID=1590643 RepID=A0ABW5TUW7_9SPHI
MQKEFETELLKTQIEVQEQTLKTVAQDLHDNIGQLLSLTAVTLSTLNLSGDDKAMEKVSYLEEINVRSLNEVKALSKLLHSEDILSKGISEAIYFEIEWLKKSEKFELEYVSENSGDTNDNTKNQLILFRLFQESINNILQHSFATKIKVVLIQTDEFLTLIIEDNGVGFKMDNQKELKGIGLNNMKRRVELIKGTLSIQSEIEKGTKINITIPNHS